MTFKKWLLAFLVLLLAGGVIAYFAVPWKNILQERITAFLYTRGIQNVSFTLDDVGLHEATITNIKIGAENPLLLSSIDVQYSPKELLDGNFRDIALTGLDININQTEEGWKIAGLEGLQKSSSQPGKTQTLTDIVNLLPFSKITVTDSHLRINGNSIKAALPFNLTLTKTPAVTLDMTVNASSLTAANSDISLGVITIKAAPDGAGKWAGTWNLASANFGEMLPNPLMMGSGTLEYDGALAAINGAMNSPDKTQDVTFKTNFDIKDSTKNTLTVLSASMPFKEGKVSAKNVVVPFDRKKNITINLSVQKVSLDALLQTLTGKRVSATGTVSGSLPVILRPGGSYTLGKGTLKADSQGLIQMPGDAIPGDNEQVQLVRQILENLHYSVFSAGVDTTGDKKMVVRLSLEGNNPDVYNGRLVKLNVNLTGDILDFIQQNAMLFTNPEQLLRQEQQ